MVLYFIMLHYTIDFHHNSHQITKFFLPLIVDPLNMNQKQNYIDILHKSYKVKHDII